MNDGNEKGVSWKTCMKLAITAVAVFLIIRYWGSVESFVGLLLGGMLAIFAGLVISYIVNIPLRFFERKLPGPTGDGTRNRALSIALSVICAVAVLLFVGMLVIPHLIEAIVTLAQATPEAIDTISNNQFIASLIPAQLVAQLKSIDWNEVVNSIVSWLQSGVASSLPQIMTIVGQIGAWFMGVILAFWFLSEKDKLSAGVHKVVKTYLGERADAVFVNAIKVADSSFHGYIVGAALESIIFGSLVAIACTLAGMPDALMLGALVGVMSLIPMIGALIGAILGAIIILATSWQKAIIFLVVFFIVQQIEANVFYPRVVGRQVGLTGMWPLIGITLGVAIFGFVGAFVGVPLTATVFRIARADIKRREELPGDSPSPLEKIHQSLSD
ncbi:MAG: AI-2E family transporter [Coriobacteriaceae bacterium]|nr:AI-2E family transporter [Coriobacteriaceae bacterium]